MATSFLLYSGISFCHSLCWVRQCLIAGEVKSSSFSEKSKPIQGTASRPLSEATDQSFFKGNMFSYMSSNCYFKITFAHILTYVLIFWNF